MQKASFKIKGLTYSNEVCPIHHVKKVSVGNLKPICRLCEQEKIEQEKQIQVKQFAKDQVKGFIKRSLVDRQGMFECTFDSFEAPRGTERYKAKVVAGHTAVAYLNHPDKKFNTVFFGKAGTGKTHLAMALLNFVNKNAMQKCLLLSVPRLLDKNRQWFKDPTSTVWSEGYTIEQVRRADLVVVDDLGAETANGNASNFVQSVIFNIYEANQRIITTTNLNLQRLSQTYDERLLSRIEEHAEGHMYDFSNLKDLRAAS